MCATDDTNITQPYIILIQTKGLVLIHNLAASPFIPAKTRM
jgi:hypothetical protein